MHSRVVLTVCGDQQRLEEANAVDLINDLRMPVSTLSLDLRGHFTHIFFR